MEEKNENVVEETTQDQVEQKPVEEKTVEEKPQAEESKFESAGDDSIIKVDLSKPPVIPEENETKEDNANDSGVATESENAEPTQEQKEVQPEAETQETPVLEEITEESTEEEVAEAEATGKPLPEGVQKLVDFMDETGGDLNDYVKLNQNYSEMDNQDLLYEYYKQTKPHLNNEEINFLMEDEFSFNEDQDDEREIRRKKLALKEQVANAKSH